MCTSPLGWVQKDPDGIQVVAVGKQGVGYLVADGVGIGFHDQHVLNLLFHQLYVGPLEVGVQQQIAGHGPPLAALSGKHEAQLAIRSDLPDHHIVRLVQTVLV